tara:strand:+ start:41 stop:310 length:270 start_codon:yes stop_codon:yes gene_type:complete
VKSLILSTIVFLFPFSVNAGFPEGAYGYGLKKIEESFRLPCDEIGNDDCIARALGVAYAMYGPDFFCSEELNAKKGIHYMPISGGAKRI